MTSRFQKPIIRFKSPAVCKKSPPGPDVNAFPATLMNAFFEAIGQSSTGQPVNTVTTITLTRTSTTPIVFTVEFTHNQVTWNLTLFRVAAPNDWELAALGSHQLGGTFASSNLNFAARQLNPFDSNYLPMSVTLGSGNSAARIML